MALTIGEIHKLTVKRETDISYTLTDGIQEYFLHFNQTPNHLQIGDKVDAFLYYDQKKRLCATLERPLITTKKYGLVSVVATHSGAGVFVNIGIAKDILLSKDFLPSSFKQWPQDGDQVYCILKGKSDQLVARLINKTDVLNPKTKLNVGDEVRALVMHIAENGIGLFTEQMHYIFIHKSLMRKDYRIGEYIDVKIININANDDYNASLIEPKEKVRFQDSDIILNTLKSRGGVIPLGNASTPDEILKFFKMSKSAFKRAVGLLYKNRLITIEDNRITLNNFTPE